MKNKENYLLEQISSPGNLLKAWRSVRSNIPSYRRKKSSGPDGISLYEFEQNLPLYLNALRYSLKNGSYQPQAPLTFELNKKNGGTRKLALLNISDRVAQRAAQQVIEPLYEPDFLPCNYGFRPGHSIQDAILNVQQDRSGGYPWVVDGDIYKCFDMLDHKLLLHYIQRRVNDRQVIRLIKMWLDIGVLQFDIKPAKTGSQSLEKLFSSISSGSNWINNSLPERGTDFKRKLWGDESIFRENHANDFTNKTPSGIFFEEDEITWDQIHNRDFSQNTAPQKAVNRLAASGMMLGGSLLRNILADLGPEIMQLLKHEAGRAILKQRLIIGGGVIGLSAGAAAAIYAICQHTQNSSSGVLQGSPLSPLLANIYLHPFDVNLTNAGYKLVRYADDWVILCKDLESAEKAYNLSLVTLTKLRLKINQEKTKILSPSEPLHWLGEVIP